MSFLITTLVTITILVSLNALYVAGEFSTVASRRTRISQLAAKGNRLARQLLPILEDSKKLDRYVAACQLGITVSSLVLGAFGQSFVATRLVDPLASLVVAGESLFGRGGLDVEMAATTFAETISTTGILILFTMLQVVVGELLPKSIAVQYPERLAQSAVVPVRWSTQLFRPLIWLFNGSGNMLLRVLNLDHQDSHARVHSPAEIEILVTESHEGGLLDDEERQMLRNAFRLRDLIARQVMAHRTRIVAAAVETGVIDLLEMALEAGHTRIPIYQNDIDDVIGFVHIKDLFRLYVEENANLAEILRDVVHVPETMPALDVWETLQDRRQYMAIVFDEYGGTAGLITIEDLIEEIFGELQDEFDDETAIMTFDQEGRRIHLRGDLLISDVNEYLDLNLPEEEVNTLSGLVFNTLGRPPEVEDEIMIGDSVIRVEKMEGLGVLEVSLQIGANQPVPRVEEWEIEEEIAEDE